MTGPSTPIPPECKRIARHVAAVFGGSFRVGEYRDNSESLSVDVLSCRDQPETGVTSYSTIGLSSHAMPWGEREFSLRLELAGVCVNNADAFPNLLSSAAFTIIRGNAVYHPGTVIRDLVRQSGVSAVLPHLFLASPFLWEDQLAVFDSGVSKVAWLLAVPVSETEFAYLRKNGEQALERLLEERATDLFDPARLSIV